MRLSTRFFCFLIIISGVSILGSLWLVIQDFQESRHSLAQTRSAGVWEHVRRSCERRLSEPDASELQTIVSDLARTLSVSIQIVAVEGRILGSFAGNPIHAVRPGLHWPGDEGWNRGVWSGPGMINSRPVFFRTAPLNSAWGRELRIGLPLPSHSSFPWGKLFAFSVLLVTAAVAMSKILARSVHHEVEQVTAAVEQVHQGNKPDPVDVGLGDDFYPLVRALSRLSHRVQESLASLREQKKGLDAILNGMQEGVLVLDAQGRVVIANRSIRHIFRLAGRIIAREPIEFIHSPELKDAYTQIIDQGQREAQRLLVHLSGNRFYDTTIIPVSVGPNGELKVVMVFHDVTELKRLEQVRKDFVANVSHELRTPLTSIKGYTETLLSGPTPDPQTLQSFIQVIQKNANSMNHLLEDLLQLARLEAMDQPMEVEAVNVRMALSTAWEVCAPAAEDKNITLCSHLRDKEVWVLSDPEQLVRVLINLVDNAIKYSPEGDQISIRAKYQPEHWTISVQDNGPGVSSSLQQRIFERFFRAEKEVFGQHVPGTGLGLSICKHIVLNQGGRIWVTSPVPGRMQGSIFRFSLPAAEPKNPGFAVGTQAD